MNLKEGKFLRLLIYLGISISLSFLIHWVALYGGLVSVVDYALDYTKPKERALTKMKSKFLNDFDF